MDVARCRSRGCSEKRPRATQPQLPQDDKPAVKCNAHGKRRLRQSHGAAAVQLLAVAQARQSHRPQMKAISPGHAGKLSTSRRLRGSISASSAAYIA